MGMFWKLEKSKFCVKVYVSSDSIKELIIKQPTFYVFPLLSKKHLKMDAVLLKNKGFPHLQWLG